MEPSSYRVTEGGDTHFSLPRCTFWDPDSACPHIGCVRPGLHRAPHTRRHTTTPGAREHAPPPGVPQFSVLSLFPLPPVVTAFKRRTGVVTSLRVRATPVIAAPVQSRAPVPRGLHAVPLRPGVGPPGPTSTVEGRVGPACGEPVRIKPHLTFVVRLRRSGPYLAVEGRFLENVFVLI